MISSTFPHFFAKYFSNKFSTPLLITVNCLFFSGFVCMVLWWGVFCCFALFFSI